LASALVVSTLGVNVAVAQTATTRTDAPAASATHREGEWRASKLVGVNVYNDANEKIGDISEIILDKSGKVANVIIGVGGFLGMGEHYVAVGYDKLKWVNEPARSATIVSDRPTTAPAKNVDSNTRTASDGNARTTTGTAVSSARNTNWYPDHVVYNATKAQLKSMPGVQVLNRMARPKRPGHCSPALGAATVDPNTLRHSKVVAKQSS
jgi:hypothetical protein